MLARHLPQRAGHSLNRVSVATGPEASGGLRQALTLLTSASLLVPVAGLITVPILAHTLGVTGRGEVAAAIAPNSLLVSIATLGLPEALTYYVAKHPEQARSALARCVIPVLTLGVVGLVAFQLALPYLTGGDPGLAELMLLGTALAVPMLLVNLLRGAAAGRQLWRAVAAERLGNSLLRVAALAVLAATGQLTVLVALLVISLAPIVAGLVYWPLLARDRSVRPVFVQGGLTRTMLSFGRRVWIGAVASMLLARIGQILLTPLSGVEELGVYSVAVTVSDVPLIVALAIRDGLYGVSSRSPDSDQVATTTRVTLIVGTVGCVVLGGTLPWWIDLAFGPGFAPALVPTWILMASTVVSIPGFLAAAGLAAWGRPGLRSIGVGITLAVNIPLFILLAPHLGATGGALAMLASNLVGTIFLLAAAARVLDMPVTRFLLVTRADLQRVATEIRRLRDRRS